MSKKHTIIKDADENIDYEVEEVVEENEPEHVDEHEHEENVCPECGKDPCECESAPEAAVFTEEEIAALKKLISIVPAIEEALVKLAEKQEPEHEEKQEQTEIKQIEETTEPDTEPADEEEEFEEEEEVESITDSIGSIEPTTGDSNTADINSTEATMAERFKKYYGGN